MYVWDGECGGVEEEALELEASGGPWKSSRPTYRF